MWAAPSWVHLHWVLHPVLCCFLCLAVAMACIAALIASATACVMLIHYIPYLMLAYICLYDTMIVSVCLFETLLAYVCLPETSTPVSCFSEENTVLCTHAYLLLTCASIRNWESICAHAYIYNGGAPYWTIYKMLIGCSNYAVLGVLFYVCLILKV